MRLIISITDFNDYKFLTQNLDSSDIEPVIFEAQEFDVAPVLGPTLYVDLLNNITATKYKTLINGETYTPTGGTAPIFFRGLKPVLAYYTYARMIKANGLKSTNSGFVLKELENSIRISSTQLTELIAQARSGAKKYEDDLRCYLNDHQTTYPLWGCTVQKNKGYGFRMKSVG